MTDWIRDCCAFVCDFAYATEDRTLSNNVCTCVCVCGVCPYNTLLQGSLHSSKQIWAEKCTQPRFMLFSLLDVNRPALTCQWLMRWHTAAVKNHWLHLRVRFSCPCHYLHTGGTEPLSFKFTVADTLHSPESKAILRVHHKNPVDTLQESNTIVLLVLFFGGGGGERT